MALYSTWLDTVFTSYLSGKTLKLMLVTPDFVQDGQVYRSEVTADEVSGTGYTAGGKPVFGIDVTSAPGSLTITFDDVLFGPVDLAEIGGVVLYVSTGSAATDVLILADLYDEPVEADSSFELKYRPPTDGLVVGTIGEDA